MASPLNVRREPLIAKAFDCEGDDEESSYSLETNESSAAWQSISRVARASLQASGADSRFLSSQLVYDTPAHFNDGRQSPYSSLKALQKFFYFTPDATTMWFPEFAHLKAIISYAAKDYIFTTTCGYPGVVDWILRYLFKVLPSHQLYQLRNL